MNNWHLLLIAVVAVLQPIESFTELNLIDGRQECCDHRSNSITQDTRLYGTYRKSTPEERRLSSREDIREERWYEAQNDPITRSRERLSLERVERQIAPESATRLSAETRFARDQEHRYSSAETKESRQTRQDLSRKTREYASRDTQSQYERSILDSRRIKMSRDDVRHERFDNKRPPRASLASREARRVRDSDDLHRVSTKRETVAVLRQGRGDVAHATVRRDSRMKLQLDNIRERRSLDRRTRDDEKENNHPSSLDSKSRQNERKNHRSLIDSRKQRRSTSRISSERIDEHRRDQNRASRDRTSAVLRDSYDRGSAADHRRESRDTIEQVDRSKRDTNGKFDERQQQRDENRLFREKLTILRERRISDEQTQQSRILDAARHLLLQRSHDITAEHRQNSRVPQKLEATSRVERLVKSDEKRDDHRQPSPRSLDRVSVQSSRVSHDLMEPEYNSRNCARFPENNIREDRTDRHRRDVRSMDKLDEKREQRDENRISRDRTLATLREIRESSGSRQNTRRTASFSRFEINSRSERQSRTNGDLRDSVRFDVDRREHQERKASREENLNRISRNIDRRPNDLTRTFRFTERASSVNRISKTREDIRSLVESRDERQEVRERDERKASRDRTSVNRLFRETRAGNRNRETTGDSRIDTRIEIIKNRADVRTGQRFEIRRQQNENRSTDRVSFHQSRNVLASRNNEIRSERLMRSRDYRRTNGRKVRHQLQVLRTVEYLRESRKMNDRDVQSDRHHLSTERKAQHMRIEAKQLGSSDFVIPKVRTDTRRDAFDARYRNFEASARKIDETSENQYAMTWQMVFYILQGAYLCGFLMQVLNEKSNKGKSRNLTGWLWTASTKDLVKVD